jgi:hypothetical protein
MHMTRRLGSAVTAVAGCLALGGSPALAASAVTHGSGTFTLSPPTLLAPPTFAGTNVIAVEAGTLSFAGAIDASGTLVVRGVDHQAIGETFTGTWSAPAAVDGRTGVLDLRFEGTDNGVFSGTVTAQGTGGLQGLHGHGVFSGQDVAGGGVYSLDYVDNQAG